MKFINLFLLFVIGSITLNAQTFSQEFGKIGAEEINLTKYSKDETAEAVVLFDIGKTYFDLNDNTFDIIFERKTRIKILSDAGIKYAEIEIPLYRSENKYEKILELEAYTYNFENGNLVKLKFDTANSYIEKGTENWFITKFAMPNIKIGSIIEYRYKLTSDFYVNLPDWSFQSRIPVVYSEYLVKMVPFFSYAWILQGTDKFHSYETYTDKGLAKSYGGRNGVTECKFNDVVHKFVMKNIPAFKDDEYITSINDYLIKIDFQLEKFTNLEGMSTNFLSTWNELIKTLLKADDFGKFEKKSQKIASELFNVDSLKLKTQDEQFDFILNYVKKNFSMNNFQRNYTSKSPSSLVKEKIGTSTELNLFTIGLLNACGIETYPVILSTRANGKIKYNYPYINYLNYVVIYAKVNGNFVLSDATDELNFNYRIPKKCINDKGLIIKKGDVEWVSLQTTAISEIQKNIFIDFKDSDLNANFEIFANEYDALDLRNSYGEDKKNIMKLMELKDYICNDSSIVVSNYKNIEEPYSLKCNLKIKPDVINDKIYFFPFINETITKNPLKQTENLYNIDLIYSQKRTLNSVISIPEGYKVEFVPENLSITNEMLDIIYSVKKNDKNVVITFQYYLKKSVYQAKDYTKLKYYFGEIVKKGNEKVVLSKI